MAHHITQRGTNRQTVFYSQKDRRVYLGLLREYSRQTEVGILAYCLMMNHIHLIAVPRDVDSLAICLRRTHGRYAQYLNARRMRSGHLWQNRFYSCALDSSHLRNALRYVEQNPVRAGLVAKAEDFVWSSTEAHLSGTDTWHLLDMDFWQESGGAEHWTEMLCDPEEEVQTRRLRRATYSGMPLGTQEFIDTANTAMQYPIHSRTLRKAQGYATDAAPGSTTVARTMVRF
jgi:putative transposase